MNIGCQKCMMGFPILVLLFLERLAYNIIYVLKLVNLDVRKLQEEHMDT